MSLEIEYVDAGVLVPWDKNPKLHDIEALAKSVERFEARQPITVQRGSNRVIAGHGRLEVYKHMGMKQVPVIWWDVDDKTAEAYAVADNQHTIAMGWDESLLAEVISGISEEDRLVLGFEEDYIEDLLASLEEPPVFLGDPDEIPEEVETRTNPGELWKLGDHRLLCADSGEREAWERLMGKKRADLIFTDPPYGVSIGDKNKTLNTVPPSGRCLENIAHDTDTPEELYTVLLGVFRQVHAYMKNTASYYMCAPQGGGLGMMMMMMKDAGLEARHVLIWVKNQPTFSIGRLDYDYQHEPILYGWKKTHKFYGEGEHTKSTWFVDRPRESKLHPTMKPVALVENALLNSTKQGHLIVDPFGGSGTTLIAAQISKRTCHMIELDPKYCDVILARWERVSGKTAELVEE